MKQHDFEEGDCVIPTAGDLEGRECVLIGFDDDDQNILIIAPIDVANVDEAYGISFSDVELALPIEEVPGFGLSADELAEYVATFVGGAMSRAIETADDTEEEEYQNFEAVELEEVLQMTLTEISDLVVSIAMIDLRIRRLMQGLKGLA